MHTPGAKVAGVQGAAAAAPAAVAAQGGVAGGTEQPIAGTPICRPPQPRTSQADPGHEAGQQGLYAEQHKHERVGNMVPLGAAVHRPAEPQDVSRVDKEPKSLRAAVQGLASSGGCTCKQNYSIAQLPPIRAIGPYSPVPPAPALPLAWHTATVKYMNVKSEAKCGIRHPNSLVVGMAAPGPGHGRAAPPEEPCGV